MKLKSYLQDKFPILCCYCIMLIILSAFLKAFRIEQGIIYFLLGFLSLFGIFFLFYEYFRRKRFYDDLFRNLERLDRKYLVLETVQKPDFYEGELLYQALYEANKSMTELVSTKKRSMDDFKEFLELWVHEVKLPLSSLLLMSHNNPDVMEQKYREQLNRINRYTEEVLYYVRAEEAEKDYLIKQVPVDSLIHNSIIKNQEDLLAHGILLDVEKCGETVVTDAKWMEFILDQILNNSVKYRRKDNPSIQIRTEKAGRELTIIIRDNGIGVSDADLPRVFEKSFTGENGRLLWNDNQAMKSTGMGLYISKSLCDKLGHKIEILSKENQYTELRITFL